MVIQPINGNYELEILVGGNEVESLKARIATFNIVFSKASTTPQLSDLHYEPKPEIIFKLAGEREDPQSVFTLFVVFLIGLSFVAFLYSLIHLKVNFSLFPLTGLGAILNLLFLGLLGTILYVLINFWLTWTFIETVKVLAALGNYSVTQLCQQSSSATTPSSTSIPIPRSESRLDIQSELIYSGFYHYMI